MFIKKCPECNSDIKPKIDICQDIKITGKFWSNLVISAKKRNIELNLNINDLLKLFKQQNGLCNLSGLSISLPNKRSDKWTASVDRINPYLDYNINNIQFLHKDINRIKWTNTQEQFKNYCSLVYNHLKSQFEPDYSWS